MTKAKGWTDADYEAKGQTKLTLRLAKEAAESLSDLSDETGVSRQKIIETVMVTPQLRSQLMAQLFANKELMASLAANPASVEQPLRNPEDYSDK